MPRTARDLLGGGLRPNDPRRFLIEAMVGAMNADGVVEASERGVLERHLARHPLLEGLALTASRTLIDLTNAAIQQSGGAAGRVPAIARGLPARIHRFAAYGMAAEVCAADGRIVPAESDFLERLRLALRITPKEGEHLVQAALGGRIGDILDHHLKQTRRRVPLVAEVFALRAHARGTATDAHLAVVRDFFRAIPDLELPAEDLEAELYRAFRKPRPEDVNMLSQLKQVGHALPDPVDRYWLVVYALAAEMPATVISWRAIPFIGAMQAAFTIGNPDMEMAALDALCFPPAMPRPS